MTRWLAVTVEPAYPQFHEGYGGFAASEDESPHGYLV